MKPPLSDWENLPHEVNGADPDEAHYRRRLADGRWQWWWHLGARWVDEARS